MPAPAIKGPISTPNAESVMSTATTASTAKIALRKIGRRVRRRACCEAASLPGGANASARANRRSISVFTTCQIRLATSRMMTLLRAPLTRRVRSVSRLVIATRSIR